MCELTALATAVARLRTLCPLAADWDPERLLEAAFPLVDFDGLDFESFLGLGDFAAFFPGTARTGVRGRFPREPAEEAERVRLPEPLREPGAEGDFSPPGPVCLYPQRLPLLQIPLVQ